MEMMVTKDGQSDLKRNKIDDSMNEEDRISDLPDFLLIDIISRLDSTKEAIRTGTLSKRWQHLWPYVSNLIFIFYMSNSTEWERNPQRLSDFVSYVDKTLTQCRGSNLHKVKICATYDAKFESQVNNWIRYAVSCNVQELELLLGFRPEFVVDQFIFLNSCFTCLTLNSCVLNPNGAISWSKLTRLLINDADLSEALIQNILSGCPLLERLQLLDCYGYQRIDIASKSVKHFELNGYIWPGDDDHDDIVEINAPYVVSLIVTGQLFLLKLLLLDLSSLVKADLDYIKKGYDETTRREGKEDMLKAFIQSLGHVKELKIGIPCVNTLSRLEAKGFISPSNLKVADRVSPVPYNSDSDSNSDRYANESGDSDRDSEELLLDDGVESEGG